MSNDLIRYDLLVREALCGVVRRVLGDVARGGLPGDHHFYITFRTHAAGVRLSSRMRELYPDEMTIILQHQFEDLKVTDHAFEVGLSFKGVPEILLVPFDALSGFFDPSVQFSMKLEAQGDGDDEEKVSPSLPASATQPVSGRPTPLKPSNSTALATVPKIGRATTVAQDEPSTPSGSDLEGSENGGDEAKVISIDAFRKKP